MRKGRKRPRQEVEGVPDGSWRRMLEAKAIRNAAASAETRADGTVRVTVRTQPLPWMTGALRWIIRPKQAKPFTLDRLGAEVWGLCDGRRVEEMIETFAERHKLTFHEARASVSSYLRSLVQRGIVAVAYDNTAD